MTTIADCRYTAQAAALAEFGLRIDQIADWLRIHRSSVYRRLLVAGVARRWHPLTDAERRRILELLEHDLSRREVARITGRGLGTVSRIGTAAQEPGGRRDETTPRRLQRLVRCPTCGGMVAVLPCVLCTARGM